MRLGGDDVASGPAGYTVTVTSGTMSQGSNFGSRPLPMAEIQGTLWNDLNGNGVQDNGEAGLAGRKVYVDENHNRVWDAGEPFALTDANGNYAITGLPPGTYDVLEALPAGWEQTTPSQGTAQQRLFTIPNTWPGQIVELDPANGSELERFATPDGSTSGTLAYDGTSLFYVNGQTLWQLDPNTGAVIRSDQIEIWRRRGYESFQGVAELDGELYLLDQSDQSLVEFDPGMHLVTRVLTLSAPSLNSMPMLDGDLTAITASDTLLATGGWNDTSSGQWEQGVLQIDPATGEISPLFVFPPEVTKSLVGFPRSLAVVDGNIYAGTTNPPSGMAAPLYVFSGSGLLEQTIPLSYGMYALGGDDVASGPAGYTVTVTSGTVSQGSNFGSRPLPMAEIQGTLFNDLNGNGVRDNGETPLAGRKVYVDENHNRVWDAGEPFALTDANGNYAITGLPPGTYDVLEALPADWEQTTPSQGTAQQRLFTVAAETTGVSQIVELNPTDGSEIRRFSAPESPTSNSELAYDGTSLFYVSGAEPAALAA